MLLVFSLAMAVFVCQSVCRLKLSPGLVGETRTGTVRTSRRTPFQVEVVTTGRARRRDQDRDSAYYKSEDAAFQVEVVTRARRRDQDRDSAYKSEDAV